MSFQAAMPHARQILQHLEAGNAAKAMHHVGHVMRHLRSMTSMASTDFPKTRIPSDSSQGSANPMNPPSKPSGIGLNVGGGGTPQMDAINPQTSQSGVQKSPAFALRSRLSGLGK